MRISEVCIQRPVFASVISLLLIAFGIICFERLPLREYPDIDAPIVSIRTTYPGAAASVVETRITEVIEDRISGLEGIRFIDSSSEDGQSNVNIEFELDRDIESAANDVRDRVSRVLDNLPEEAELPDVQKQDSNDDVIMWLNLTSDKMSVPDLTDYAERYLLDRFSVLDGVARVRVGGAQSYAMRVWIDRVKLAAYGLAVTDIEDALRRENVELPAGAIESVDRQFSVRVERLFVDPENFRRLVLVRGEQGKVVRLGDVATVVKSAREHRTDFRGNGETMVGLGIAKQSTANTIDVSRAAKIAAERINQNLPEGMYIHESFDTSVFIEEAINQVYSTLAIAIGLVILVIFLFLGDVRAMMVPAITVPISLIATFTVLYAMGFTINLLTLLALVLAIGLVVDDAIVMLENIHRRMEQYGETALVAAYKGSKQVGFAIVATTAVLVAVFVPITVLQGDMGRLFSEFALTISAAVVFSSLVALTLCPVIAANLLQSNRVRNRFSAFVDARLTSLKNTYQSTLTPVLNSAWLVLLVFVGLLFAAYAVFKHLPSEYVPKEDRGAFYVMVNGPEGASYDYMAEYMAEIERRILPLVENEEAIRVLVRVPRGFGSSVSTFNSGMVIVVLNSWDKRRSAWTIMDEIRNNLSDLPGVQAFPVMRQGIGGRVSKPVQFVIGGGSYDELAAWRNQLFDKISADNPGFVGIDSDYKETSPQVRVVMDYDRAADLGVSVRNMGRTLETLLGSRRVTTYIDNGEEYDVLLEGIREQQNSPQDLTHIYVRSETSGQLVPLANLVSFEEVATSQSLNRYNRTRAITIDANLEDDFALADALVYLENFVRSELPDHAVIDYKGQSRDFKFSASSHMMVFGLGILVMFLVLAAQFESYVSPFVITLTVPLAILGGMLGLWVTGSSLNLFSQIGMLMLIGLAAKNGILIVEFANQLRDEGQSVREAIVASASLRLRPILMTSITTVAGSIPLIISSGAGAETRYVLGVTLIAGVSFATILTLVIVPTAYDRFARYTSPPGAVARKLEHEIKAEKT